MGDLVEVLGVSGELKKKSTKCWVNTRKQMGRADGSGSNCGAAGSDLWFDHLIHGATSGRWMAESSGKPTGKAERTSQASGRSVSMGTIVW
jgi:hypothetical protein